jgi:hypothetical protein
MCLPVKPFKVEREWEHAGLKCAVTMPRENQTRCGYVRVPPGHPLHGKPYDEVSVDVHGGLTFGAIEPCAHEDGTGWWFGFDFAHSEDASFAPNLTSADFTDKDTRRIWELTREYRSDYDGEGCHYWPQPEVEAEVESLAEQLAAVSGGIK